MINIAKRNIRLFFRDKTSVFFSSLSVIIIMSLYVLFLGDMMSNWEGGVTGVRFLMDSWIVAGSSRFQCDINLGSFRSYC